MTAEIAVMNKRAVALAADSAVTIDYPGMPKIYFTANKLFMLSQYQPIGIMFYGTADFMGIPWETIVKLYRNALGDKVFPSLNDYVTSFFDFIQAESGLLLSEKQQITYFFRVLYSIPEASLIFRGFLSH